VVVACPTARAPACHRADVPGARRHRGRLLVGWLGPRGITFIVFGPLAFNVLTGHDERVVLLTMVIAVLGSVVFHGAGAPAAARAYRRSQTRLGR
jgi:sodium/hydrogen antiporter